MGRKKIRKPQPKPKPVPLAPGIQYALAMETRLAMDEYKVRKVIRERMATNEEIKYKIDEADAALQTAINALSNELNATNEKVAELETFIIIVCVISGVAFCGCGTLAVFYIIDKKKNI